MHLPEADSELLKKWTIKKLEDISDADSDVLADYVLALITTDEPEAVVRANCIENLKDFLPDNVQSFVNDVFTAIASKSYDPSRPPPKPSAPIYQPSKRQSLPQHDPSAATRKRSYQDLNKDGSANDERQTHQGGDRPLKQAKRGGRGHEQLGGRQQQALQMPMPPPGMPPLDPNNPMATLLAMQQVLGMMPGMQGLTAAGSPLNGNGFAPARMGPRCRDYDTKGYCAAGASCPYEHGNDPYVVPQADHGYDPNNAQLLNVTPHRIGHVSTAPKGRGRGSTRHRGRGGSNWRGSAKRADFSLAGPNRDTSLVTVVVEQIPDEKCNEQNVRDFFSEFGPIEEVTVQPENKLAIVEFGSNESAQAAYDSPKVVFDNRFVKVYWHRPNKPGSRTNGHNNPPIIEHKTQDIDMLKEEEQIDTLEVARRQEEAQRKHEEATKQREEAEKKKSDLDSKIKAMEAERKKMADLLAKKTGKTASSTAAESPANSTHEDSEEAKSLRETLSKLKDEAISLGIDPEVAANGSISSPGYRGRGAFRGRARGRGYRGGWGGATARGGAVLRLDNRPKTVTAVFVDASYADREEALRQFLLFNSIGFASISKHPDRDDAAVVAFAARYEAEEFLKHAGQGSDLPYVGNVELSWYKADDKRHATNGTAETDSKMDTTEPGDGQPPESRKDEGYEGAEDENLDRF